MINKVITLIVIFLNYRLTIITSVNQATNDAFVPNYLTIYNKNFTLQQNYLHLL